MNTLNHRVVLRADGNAHIGLGHLMRTASLALILKKRYHCVLITARSSSITSEIANAFDDIVYIDSPEPDKELGELKKLLTPSDFFVTDGYYFNENYIAGVKDLIGKVIMIDDHADQYYIADLIINHGNESVQKNYRTIPGCKVLTGFKYLILRRFFLNAALDEREINKVDTVFICLGGADPFNITIKAIQACSEVVFIRKIIVVVGNAYANKAALEMVVANVNKSIRIEIHHDKNAVEMGRLIRESEISICPSSSIALEACCIKSGLITGMVADNQKYVHEQLLKSKCCISVGDFNQISISEFAASVSQLGEVAEVNAIMQNQHRQIDGLSGKRLLHEFKLLEDAGI